MTATDQKHLEANELKPNHKSAYDSDMFRAKAGPRKAHGDQAQGHRRRDHRPRRRGRRGGAAAHAGRHRGRRPRSRDVAHEARLRAGRAPQQLPRLAAGRAEGESGDSDVARDVVVADRAARRDSSDEERRRRHDAALLGAELAAEPVGLQGGERDEAPLRRVAHSEGLDGRGLAVRSRGARAVLRQGRIRGRRVGTGRQHQRQDRSARQSVRGAAQAAVSDAGAALDRVHRQDGSRGAVARLASVSGAGRHQLAVVSESLGVHVSRLLQPRRLSRGREELDGGHDDSARPGDRASEGRHAGARHDARGRRQRPGDRRQLRHRRRRVLPAGESRAAGELHLRKRPPAAALEVEGVSERTVEQARTGRPALLQSPPGRGGDGAVPVQSERLVRAAGAGRRRGQLGRRQLRSFGPRFHRRRQPVGATRTAGRLARPA